MNSDTDELMSKKLYWKCPSCGTTHNGVYVDCDVCDSIGPKDYFLG